MVLFLIWRKKKKEISRGHSSVGRALPLQGRGQGFESPCLHPVKIKNFKSTPAIFIYFVFLCFLIPTIYPTSTNPDRGIFESVSFRLLAQDRLYEDVWDNKDPLFYYLNALTLKISPVADLFLEIGFFFLLSLIIFQINRNYTKSKTKNFLVSFIISPLILIQINYFPGYTHLPGEVLFLGIILFILKGQENFAGILLGILLFTKITLFPIALLMLIFLGFKKIIKVKITIKFFTLTSAIVVLTMIFRQEFIPYANSLYLNYFYTLNTPSRFETFFSLFNIKIDVISILTLVFIIYLNFTKFKVTNRKELLIMNSLMIATLFVAFFASKHPHHLQILTPTILITTLLFFHLIQNNKKIFRFLVTIILIYLVSISNLYRVKDNWNNLKLFYKIDIEKSFGELALLDIASTGTYARLGQNDDNAHAKGLQNWKLACPRFHQYPFEDVFIFKQTLDCIDEAEFLIISPQFKEYSQTSVWNEFVKLAMIEVGQKFNCKTLLNNQVCQNTRWGNNEQ